MKRLLSRRGTEIEIEFEISDMKKYFKPVMAAFVLPVSFMFFAHTKADNAFLSKVSQANLAEIEAGKLAQSKGTSDTVRMAGKKMVDDHTKAQNALITLARSEKITIPRTPDSVHKSLIKKLSSLSGPAFDSAYMQSEWADHQATVALFQEEMQNGTDPDAKSYAGKFLPVLKTHLKMFQPGSAVKMSMSMDSTGKSMDSTGKPMDSTGMPMDSTRRPNAF
jgi:putative membrane protein